MRLNPLALVAASWVVVLALASALAALAATHQTLPGDVDIAQWIQDLPVPGQELSDLVRTVTETEVVLATGGAVVLVLWLRGYRRQAVLLAAGLLAMGVLAVTLKEIVDRPRPAAELVERRSGFDSTSFPSGHVLSTTVLYGTLIYYGFSLSLTAVARVGLVLASFLFLTLVGPVSIWLGVHWPSDVAGSWLWALVVVVPIIVVDQLESSA